MTPDERKRAFSDINKELKYATTIAEARNRALIAAIKVLEKDGLKGVSKVLSTHGEHFTAIETEMLRRATPEFLDQLIKAHKLMKNLKSPMLCI